MYNGKHIAVVVPAYNEAGFVGEVIETVPEFVDRIYPVDDASTDDTWTEIKEAASRVNAAASTDTSDLVTPLADGGTTSRVVPIQHGTNRGVGAAIKTGYRSALADGIDVVAVMNGDGQMDPDILVDILDPVVEDVADYAKGNRLVTREHWRGMTRWRLFGNVLLTTLTRIASGYWRMTDPQNGYTAISARALEALDLSELCDEYGFLNDVLTRLNAHDMRIADVEMQAVYGEEQSSIRYGEFISRLSWLLFVNFLWRLWTKYARRGRATALPYFLGLGGGLLLLLTQGLSMVGTTPAPGPTGVLGWLTISGALLGLGMALDRRQSATLETTVRS